MGKVTRIARETRDTLGEGALWCARDGAFYWVDILAPAVCDAGAFGLGGRA